MNTDTDTQVTPIKTKDVLLKPVKKTRPNRQERRSYLKRMGLLEHKKDLRKGRLEWKGLYDWMLEVQDNIQTGRKIVEHNEMIWRHDMEEQLMQKESKIVSLLKKLGYKKKEIDKYIECWYNIVIKDKS